MSANGRARNSFLPVNLDHWKLLRRLPDCQTRNLFRALKPKRLNPSHLSKKQNLTKNLKMRKPRSKKKILKKKFEILFCSFLLFLREPCIFLSLAVNYIKRSDCLGTYGTVAQTGRAQR